MTENDPFADDNDDDDNDELELEPIDPEILASERQRAGEKTRHAELAVDINDAYDDAEPIDPVSWDDLRAYRFTTRHLLIVTALLSVVLTFIQVGSWTGLFLVAVIALVTCWFFVLKKERRERLEHAQRREETKRRIAREHGEAVDDGPLPTTFGKP